MIILTKNYEQFVKNVDMKRMNMQCNYIKVMPALRKFPNKYISVDALKQRKECSLFTTKYGVFMKKHATLPNCSS